MMRCGGWPCFQESNTVLSDSGAQDLKCDLTGKGIFHFEGIWICCCNCCKIIRVGIFKKPTAP